MSGVRIDKWLWAVRIYKTRSIAADACKKGRIIIDGQAVKASREVNVGDKVVVRKMPVIHTFLVKKIIEKRVSAKLAVECAEDQTSIEELDKLKVSETFFIKRERGSGRPTKKERREIDRLKNDI